MRFDTMDVRVRNLLTQPQWQWLRQALEELPDEAQLEFNRVLSCLMAENAYPPLRQSFPFLFGMLFPFLLLIAIACFNFSLFYSLLTDVFPRLVRQSDVIKWNDFARGCVPSWQISGLLQSIQPPMGIPTQVWQEFLNFQKERLNSVCPAVWTCGDFLTIFFSSIFMLCFFVCYLYQTFYNRPLSAAAVLVQQQREGFLHDLNDMTRPLMTPQVWRQGSRGGVQVSEELVYKVFRDLLQPYEEFTPQTLNQLLALVKNRIWPELMIKLNALPLSPQQRQAFLQQIHTQFMAHLSARAIAVASPFPFLRRQ